MSRVLVVSAYRVLRETRVLRLTNAGYDVTSAESDDDAMALLETEAFNLIVIGRRPSRATRPLDERMRELYPAILIMKIQGDRSTEPELLTRFCSSYPADVMAMAAEMLRAAVP